MGTWSLKGGSEEDVCGVGEVQGELRFVGQVGRTGSEGGHEGMDRDLVGTEGKMG